MREKKGTQAAKPAARPTVTPTATSPDPTQPVATLRPAQVVRNARPDPSGTAAQVDRNTCEALVHRSGASESIRRLAS
jgi:hypothetical protein